MTVVETARKVSDQYWPSCIFALHDIDYETCTTTAYFMAFRYVRTRISKAIEILSVVEIENLCARHKNNVKFNEKHFRVTRGE